MLLGAEGAEGGGDALARGDDRAAEAARDGVVVEVVDEAEPQGGLGPVGQRADERLEPVVVELGLAWRRRAARR